MGKGFSRGALAAKEYYVNHPNPKSITATKLAEKFWIHPSTIWRADWWKNRNNPDYAENSKQDKERNRQEELRKKALLDLVKIPEGPGGMTKKEAVEAFEALLKQQTQ